MDKLPRPILNEFRRNKIKLKYGYLGETEHFHVRILEEGCNRKFNKRWVIQFAYKPTFDKWANSTNFETKIWYESHYQTCAPNDVGNLITIRKKKQYTIPKLDQELEWCLKIAKSGLFDFNRYFSVIKTPWFIY